MFGTNSFLFPPEASEELVCKFQLEKKWLCVPRLKFLEKFLANQNLRRILIKRNDEQQNRLVQNDLVSLERKWQLEYASGCVVPMIMENPSQITVSVAKARQSTHWKPGSETWVCVRSAGELVKAQIGKVYDRF